MKEDGGVNVAGDFADLRRKVVRALGEIEPAGPPQSENEPKALLLSSTTRGSKLLPPYYLVYFLLVDFLQYQRMGLWEKSAWTVPIRYEGRLYAIEHQKMGLRISAPNSDPNARMSGRPSEQQEMDSELIAKKIQKAVSFATPYFSYRAKKEAEGNRLNVLNHCEWLFERFQFFRTRFFEEKDEVERQNESLRQDKDCTDIQSLLGVLNSVVLESSTEADWIAQAAVDAFFSWSEHAFIHIAILRGRVHNGSQVAELAAASWKEKFRASLGLENPVFKRHYDTLLHLRVQMRNFMAHGAFGKRGEAFLFHSGAGAVPVLLTEDTTNRYSFFGDPDFDEVEAINAIDSFLSDLWSSDVSPAEPYLFSKVPSILTFASDGSYSKAMRSKKAMSQLVEYLQNQMDAAANMDW
ncbi:hypothetical protein J4377_07090 [Halomonas sp. XH26]|uniref:hypothetical protein n=1 Tax=Halomonas sp. XH26 TaxID=2557993 RepID=UPI00209E13C1|nr:hypothetical protein [Halomonas sp. XH26]UTA81226.1 hypothetical protein J4377_07090 [Halomonas sp. XH26]